MFKEAIKNVRSIAATLPAVFRRCPAAIRGRRRRPVRRTRATARGDDNRPWLCDVSRCVREDGRRVDCGGECGVRPGRVLGSYSRERDGRRPGGEDLEDGRGKVEDEGEREYPPDSIDRRAPAVLNINRAVGSVGASH